MLQRLRWRLHNDLTSTSLTYVSSSVLPAPSAYRITHRRWMHLSTTDKRLVHPHQNPPMRSASSFRLRKPATTLQRAKKVQQGHNTKVLEPWIRPHSLSESLEAHRQANRNGLARDGVPLFDALGRGQDSHQQSSTSRFGIKRLEVTEHTVVKDRKIKTSAVCPPLSSEWRPSKTLPRPLRLPWTPPLPGLDGMNTVESSAERLCNEITLCGVYLSPTALERQAALNAFEEMKSYLANCLGLGIETHLVGSRAAGTEGPVSDLDINIRFKSDPKDAHDMLLARSELAKLSVAMRKDRDGHRLRLHKFINAVSVPVIVGTHLPSGLEFQIQSTSAGFDSLEVTRAFVAEYPAACLLLKTLKQILNMRGLNNGGSGGLGSYPLLNMVVTSLKLAGPHLQFESIAVQLLNFLDFWSNINFDQYRIEQSVPSESSTRLATASVDPISAVPHLVPRPRGAKHDQHLMLLQDPADPTNNLGRAVHRIHHVQACFIEAREKIRTAMQLWDDIASQGPPLKHEQSILEWCLEGDYSSFEEARQRLRKYGKQSSRLREQT